MSQQEDHTMEDRSVDKTPIDQIASTASRDQLSTTAIQSQSELERIALTSAVASLNLTSGPGSRSELRKSVYETGSLVTEYWKRSSSTTPRNQSPDLSDEDGSPTSTPRGMVIGEQSTTGFQPAFDEARRVRIPPSVSGVSIAESDTKSKAESETDKFYGPAINKAPSTLGLRYGGSEPTNLAGPVNASLSRSDSENSISADSLEDLIKWDNFEPPQLKNFSTTTNRPQLPEHRADFWLNKYPEEDQNAAEDEDERDAPSTPRASQRDVGGGYPRQSSPPSTPPRQPAVEDDDDITPRASPVSSHAAVEEATDPFTTQNPSLGQNTVVRHRRGYGDLRANAENGGAEPSPSEWLGNHDTLASTGGGERDQDRAREVSQREETTPRQPARSATKKTTLEIYQSKFPNVTPTQPLKARNRDPSGRLIPDPPSIASSETGRSYTPRNDPVVPDPSPQSYDPYGRGYSSGSETGPAHFVGRPVHTGGRSRNPMKGVNREPLTENARMQRFREPQQTRLPMAEMSYSPSTGGRGPQGFVPDANRNPSLVLHQSSRSSPDQGRPPSADGTFNNGSQFPPQEIDRRRDDALQRLSVHVGMLAGEDGERGNASFMQDLLGMLNQVRPEQLRPEDADTLRQWAVDNLQMGEDHRARGPPNAYEKLRKKVLSLWPKKGKGSSASDHVNNPEANSRPVTNWGEGGYSGNSSDTSGRGMNQTLNRDPAGMRGYGVNSGRAIPDDPFPGVPPGFIDYTFRMGAAYRDGSGLSQAGSNMALADSSVRAYIDSRIDYSIHKAMSQPTLRENAEIPQGHPFDNANIAGVSSNSTARRPEVPAARGQAEQPRFPGRRDLPPLPVSDGREQHRNAALHQLSGYSRPRTPTRSQHFAQEDWRYVNQSAEDDFEDDEEPMADGRNDTTPRAYPRRTDSLHHSVDGDQEQR